MMCYRNMMLGFGGIALLALAASAWSDPPRLRPDYLAPLPQNQWAFAKLLWQGREACDPDQCEAGYNSPPLRLSVMMEKTTDRKSNAIVAVAGMEGCVAVSEFILWETDYGKLSLEQQMALLSDRVHSVVAGLEETCKVKLASPISTDDLKRLLAG